MIKGKALLVITRLHEDGESARYDTHAFIQSCSGGWEHRDAANEEFQHLAYDVLPVPNQARRIRPGETIRLSVVFEFTYHQYSDGECDVDLEYSKVQTRRIQKPCKFYRAKP